MTFAPSAPAPQILSPAGSSNRPLVALVVFAPLLLAIWMLLCGWSVALLGGLAAVPRASTASETHTGSLLAPHMRTVAAGDIEPLCRLPQ